MKDFAQDIMPVCDMTGKKKSVDIAIIGAGASGLAAAIEAKRVRPDSGVLLLEKSARPGRKILASGNGRCNISNKNLSGVFYHGENTEFIRPAFERYGLESTCEFFEDMGVPLREEGSEGRLYPYSLSAGAVIDALRHEAEHLKIDLLTNANVLKIARKSSGLDISCEIDKNVFIIDCKKAIVACGGAASPSLGGSFAGYELLKALGHSITAIRPSIVQLECDSEYTKAMDGIRVDAHVSLITDSKNEKYKKIPLEYSGEVLLTKYGLSGPAIMQLSGRAISAMTAGERPYFSINMLPEFSQSQLVSHLFARQAARPWAKLEDFLTGLVQKRLGMMAIKAAGVAPLSRQAQSLDTKEIKAIAAQLSAWEFSITGDLGLKSAQVTAGGARTCEFDPATLKSEIVPGLYACGELLDIDGDCGGYNLQWAWSSGRLAGFSAATSL
ncbi:MAG: NAD(P)/FAD-dependent oxidoreductase [Christensenellales bacterium]|jgi:predicted Rossmann fold flavoprotein